MHMHRSARGTIAFHNLISLPVATLVESTASVTLGSSLAASPAQSAVGKMPQGTRAGATG